MRVLLTRPRMESERLAARLEPLGYVCVPAPMLEIVRVTGGMPSLEGVRSVMATSAHAFAFGPLPDSLKSLPCYCVGSTTADAARQAGFQHVRDAQGDGAALADTIARSGEAVPGGPVLHLAGRDTHPALAEALAGQGVSVTSWVVYEARAASKFPESVFGMLRDPAVPFSAALFFSARTAEIFASLVLRHGLQSGCSGVAAIGISQAAVEPLEVLRWRIVAWSESPTEDGVVARLRDAVPCA